MQKTEYDVIIIGAGAIGCAIARELSRYELRTAVLEKNSDVAGETTGRNSAVVHAGFNNAPGSMMARFCVEGNEGFETLCRELDVPFRETGKLVLGFDAADAQRLDRLLAQGRANGCRDLEILEGEALGACLREHGSSVVAPYRDHESVSVLRGAGRERAEKRCGILPGHGGDRDPAGERM